MVFPRPGFTAESAQQEIARLTETQWAQPAIGAASLSMLAVLDDCGVRADMVAGHSFGELVAMHAAGVLSESELLRVARKRGELMAGAASSPGAMTALTVSVEQVRERIARWKSSVVVANHNAPQQVVVSGGLQAIVDFEERLAAEKIAFRRASPVASGLPFGAGVRLLRLRSPHSFPESISLRPRLPASSATRTAAPHRGRSAGAAQRARDADCAAGPLRRDDRGDARSRCAHVRRSRPGFGARRTGRLDPRRSTVSGR